MATDHTSKRQVSLPVGCADRVVSLAPVGNPAITFCVRGKTLAR